MELTRVEQVILKNATKEQKVKLTLRANLLKITVTQLITILDKFDVEPSKVIMPRTRMTNLLATVNTTK